MINISNLPPLGTSHLSSEDLSIEEANIKIKLEEESEFPLSIFPEVIQDVVIELFENGNYNVDYTASSILTALATIIGNSHIASYHSEWQENCSIWVTLVGMTGQNKSGPIKTAFRAIKMMQLEYANQYKDELKNYLANNIDDKPVNKKLFTTDPTFESLISMHVDNPNGLCVMPDEFVSFMSNLMTYIGNSKQSQYLSLWDLSAISLDRKQSESSSIELPCVSLIGGIQNDVLADLKSKDKKDGFFERILYVIPPKFEKRPLPDSELNSELINTYHSKVTGLINEISESKASMILNLTNDAKYAFRKAVNSHVQPSNSDPVKSGILSKLDRYMLRFALIIEVIDKKFQDQKVISISEQSMLKAIQLKDYFYTTALRANNMILDVYESNSKEGQVIKIVKAIGKTEFTTQEWLQKADELNIAKVAYAYRLLGNTNLVRKKSKGLYESDIFI